MTRTEIERKLIDIVSSQIKMPGGALTRTTVLRDAGIDSLDALNVIFAIEEDFHISISDERTRAIETFGDIIDIVVELVPAV